MRANMRQLIIGLALVLVPMGARGSSSSQTVNVQGILRDNGGNLQSTAVALDVSLYASLAAATPFYTQHFATVPVDGGFFTVELAGGGLVFAGQPDTWIGIQVSGDPDELPRQHLDAAPYSFSAASADTVSAACVGCITNAMLSGSIDGSKVGKVSTSSSADTATNATQLGGVAASGWQKAITPAACPAGQVYSGITAAGVGTCTSQISTSTSADTATNATQLGGVAASGWQKAITPAACPAGQVYSGITAAGAGTCTSQVSTASTANAVAFSNITAVPAACTGGQFLVGYSAGAAVCAGVNLTPSGGNNGTATTVARGDHTHPGLPGTGWVKIYDQMYNANGTQTINVTPVNGTFTVRILFTGFITNCCGNPSEIYLQTSGGGTTGYNSFIAGETVGGTSVYNTGPVQPGFILGRTSTTANTELSFDYELTELPGSVGAIGHGSGAAHPHNSATTTLFRAGGNNQYTTASSSFTIQFWNTSNVNGRFTVLQLM
jgi:hypothetical protein